MYSIYELPSPHQKQSKKFNLFMVYMHKRSDNDVTWLEKSEN